MTAQFARFVLVGGLAAAANIGSRVLFSLWMGYLPAMLCAYFIGMNVAFLLNRQWVFLPSGKHWLDEYARFTVVNLFGLAQTLLIAWGLARWLFPAIGMDFHPETIAHAIGVITPIFTSFIGHKYFTFRSTHHV